MFYFPSNILFFLAQSGDIIKDPAIQGWHELNPWLQVCNLLLRLFISLGHSNFSIKFIIFRQTIPIGKLYRWIFIKQYTFSFRRWTYSSYIPYFLIFASSKTNMLNHQFLGRTAAIYELIFDCWYWSHGLICIFLFLFLFLWSSKIFLWIFD